MVLSGEPRKKSPVTPHGIDPGNVRLVAQRLNHYATPDLTLHEDYYKFLITSRSLLLRMRNVSGNICAKNQNAHFMSSNCFFLENGAIYWIMWKNTLEPEKPHMTIWRMRIACWITTATNTHSEYLTLIVFQLQQWL